MRAETTTRPIAVGDRVRRLPGRAVGLVLQVDGVSARVAWEGRLPEDLPIADLERVEGRCAA